MSEHPKGFQAYKIHLALVAHFTQLRYDAVKYNFGTRGATLDAFSNLNQRYFYEKLEQEYEDPVMFLVSNMWRSPKVFIRDLLSNPENRNEYFRCKGRLAAPVESFKNDLSVLFPDGTQTLNDDFNAALSIDINTCPRILGHLLSKKISIQSFLVFDAVFEIIKRWNASYSAQDVPNPLWGMHKIAITKSKTFFRVNDTESYKSIIQQHIIDR